MTTHNKYAGEYKATLGGKERVFKLTFESRDVCHR